MPYRGLLYFVSQSASSDYRSDPYATERRSLPNRTHGIRYASAPKRSTCIRTYAPSETVRPVCASSTTAASQASRSVEPQRMLKAVFAMVLVAVLSAFLGIFAAHVLSAAIDDGAFPLIGSADAATAEDGFSTPRSSWEQGVVPTLYQDDPQWADRPYGSRTVGDAGAAPLCLAMVHIEATGDASVGPVEVASLSQSSGYADTVEATGLLTDGAAQLGLASREIDANELAMRRELVGDRPIIASMKAGSFGSSDTYIVVTGIDEHGELAVVDPLSRDRTSRHWTFDEIISQATGLWSYTAAAESPPLSPPFSAPDGRAFLLWKACFTLLAQGSILDGKLALHIRIGEERHGEPVGGDPQGARHQARGSRVGAGRVAPDHQLAREGALQPFHPARVQNSPPLRLAD